jgi:hypothetical protein
VLKSLDIADYITYIKQAMAAVKLEAVNAYWRNVWSECFPAIDNEVA